MLINKKKFNEKIGEFQKKGDTKFNVNSVRNNMIRQQRKSLRKTKKIFGMTKSSNFVNKLFGEPPKLEDLQELSNKLGLCY